MPLSTSREVPVESEYRLRAVIRAAEIVHLEGSWCFRQIASSTPDDAVATIRIGAEWCALVPAVPSDAVERFGLSLTTFSESIENSGYVGWIASAVKTRLGSGVFVICGDNPSRGGIYDYLGYPEAARPEVRQLLDELSRPSATDPLNVDLRLFTVAEVSSDSAISTLTRFEFYEAEGVVQARYSGGRIVAGSFVGRRTSDRVVGVYAQLHEDGGQATGRSVMSAEAEADGALRLVEKYEWADGRRGINVLRSVRPTLGR